ncbi:MAG TPA: 4-alpha-glucanotransferase [Steroidobacteraceae bacterium]|nr:4-alpha-glucanotransferase [Steroidobacteraceae bacterium]
MGVEAAVQVPGRPAEQLPRQPVEQLPRRPVEQAQAAADVLARRRAGVLLHLGSLPAGLGRGGRAVIDWLAAARFSVWQVLPVGPTGADGSPYWVRSDAAGNPAFIDSAESPPLAGAEFDDFLAAARDWLPDYACFEAASRLHQGRPWWTWEEAYRDRRPEAMARLQRAQADLLRTVYEQQFAFAWQWGRLRAYAHEHGVRLFGDIPFYVAPDSAEVWAHRDQFQLTADGRPAAVAGVPPDYFSALGQLWGNPLYDWEQMRRDGFRFWRSRLARQFARMDLLRIDHFRALAAHWAVPAGAPDARGGAWHPSAGRELLTMLEQERPGLPVVAEDLGVITPDVEALRRDFGLPGMRVMQFGFDGSGDNPHLPHMYERLSVAYTGTHDNDTTLGWYRGLDAGTRQRVEFFLRARPEEMPEALVRAVLGSVAQLAVIPAQDVLGLGSEARLNTPGTATGNWSWQLPAQAFTPELQRRYAELNRIYGRVG